MDRLSIITPCTRSQNLPEIAETIRTGRELFDVCWLVIMDGRESPDSISGNAQRNSGLDAVSEGWVYFLDDDNAIHPQLFLRLAWAVRKYPNAGGFLFRQDTGNGWTRGINPVVNKIDMAQAVIRREMIGDRRFEIEVYNADGIFIESVYREHKDRFVLLEDVMAYYNRLRLCA